MLSKHVSTTRLLEPSHKNGVSKYKVSQRAWGVYDGIASTDVIPDRNPVFREVSVVFFKDTANDDIAFVPLVDDTWNAIAVMYPLRSP